MSNDHCITNDLRRAAGLFLMEDALVRALGDAEAYRLLAQEAIHALYAKHQQLTRLQDEHGRVLWAYRRLREQLAREAA